MVELLVVTQDHQEEKDITQGKGDSIQGKESNILRGKDIIQGKDGLIHKMEDAIREKTVMTEIVLTLTTIVSRDHIRGKEGNMTQTEVVLTQTMMIMGIKEIVTSLTIGGGKGAKDTIRHKT